MEAVHRLTTINVALAKHHRSKVIAGAGGSSGGESSGGSEADDTLESKAYMSILDLLGEGQIGGLVDNSPSSIFLNDTPLVSKTGQYNFDNVTWAILTGSQTQDSLGEGFDNAEFTQSLNQLVKNATPLTFTITDPNASQVRVVVATPALISTDKKGNINGSAVRFSFALSLNSGPFEELGIGQIKGKTRSRFQREYSHILPKTTSTGKKVTSWTIRVARTSPDSSSTSVQNEFYVDSYSVAVGSRLTYPNSAIVGINFNAEQFSSVPTRSYLVDGLLVKVPSNYDPKTRVYTGVWDGTFKLAVTDNPAWILYDVITNTRYGLGSFIDPSLANPARLYVIGRYCDEMVDDGFGGREPRFSINTCINSRADAYQLISDISSAFNGMTYWTGGLLGYMADMPTEVSMVYSSANVIDGMFNYAGAARKDMHSVVLVTWNDPARNYQTSVEYVEDQELVERFGVRKAEITSFGCVSRGQAHRIGKWLLYTERYQSKTISFNVGIDSSFVLPGDVIQIVDADRAGSRLGGRLKKVTADFALLDAPIDTKLIKGNTTISMRLPDGKFAERLIASVGIDVDTGEQVIYWGTPLTKLPLANAMWVISSPDLEPQTARIVSVGQGENPGEFSITAIPHNVNKFGHIESDLILETPNTSLVSPSVIVPTASVTIVQEARIDQGITIRDMNISWEQVANAVSYEVKYRKGEGNWLALPSTKGLSVDVQNIYQGEYQAQVVAVSSTGSKSRVTYSDPTLLEGQASTLPKLSSFTAKAAQFGIELDWLYGAGTVGVSHTEVHSSLDGKTFTLLGTYPDPLQHHAISGLYVASTHWFKARIADKYGNFGEWSNVVSASPDVSPDKVLNVLSDSIGPSQLENSVNEKLQDAFDTSKQAVTDAKGANQAIKDEVLARTTALNKEAADRSSAISTALSKEAADRANAIAIVAGAVTKEVTDRNTAISAEVAARTKAITDKATEINADVAAKIKTVNDGITKEITDRTAGDDAVRGELTAYKSSNDTAVTAVVKDVKTVTTAQAATASDVSGLQSTMTAVQGALSKKADAAALSSLDTKVETINGQVTSQGTSITTLNANLATTNNNVTTAQNAANAANTLAGGKGKVIVQAAAPAVADRLAQNLWIDITGGANTPKRWLTNAWVAVTDKVATDAAAAAANALSVANTKADAAAFNTLDTKVTAIEGNVTSQGTSITKLTNDLASANTAINTKASTSALNTLDTKVTGIDGKVATNASAITTLQGRATTVEGTVATKADSSAVTALTNRVTTVEGGLTTQASNTTNLQTALNVTDAKATAALPRVQQSGNYKTFKGVLAYYSTSATVTGNIVIQTPITFSAKMFSVSGKGYNYAKDKSVIDFSVGAYAYSGTTILQHGAVNSGTLPLRIRLGVKDGKVCIILTSLLPNWAYPQFELSAEIGYTLAPDSWKDDWTASVINETDLATQGIASIVEPSVLNVGAEIAANATALNTTNTEVSRVNGVVVAQGTSISKLQSDLTAVDAKAGTAVTNAATAQTTANTAVTNNAATASRVNSLESKMTTAEGAIAKKAENSAVQTLNTEVTRIAGELKSTSESSTNLGASIKALPVGGGNLLVNGDFSLNDISPWVLEKSGDDVNATAAVLQTGNLSDWQANAGPSKTVSVHCSNSFTQSQGKWLEFYQTVPVVGGKMYQFSAYTGSHRCRIEIFSRQFDINGNSLLATYTPNDADTLNEDGVVGARNGGKLLSGYKRLKHNFQAHASATTARFVLRLMLRQDSYMFMTRAMFAEIVDLNANPLAWIESGSGAAFASAANASAVQNMRALVDATSTKVTSLAEQNTILQSGLQTANGAISTKAEQSALNSTNSTLNTLSGKVETQAQSINTLTSKTATLESSMAVTDLIARASASGKLVYGDPTFKFGANDVGVYNNTYNGNVTVVRVAKQAKNPTSSGFEMRITSTGAASPALGGFVQAIASRASAVFLIKYIICLPLGYALYPAANPMGDGASDKFVGNANGTGKYETYYRLIKCGETGSFSSTGYVYVGGPTPTAAAPLNWYLASIEAYDTTDFDDMTPQLRTTVAEVQSKVNTLTTNTGATAEKVESMSAYFDAGETVDSGNLTADGGTNGAVRWTYHAMITEGDMANAKAIDNMKAEVGGTLAEWGQVINSEVKEGMSALSEQVNHVSTTLNDQTTRIDTVMASVDGIYGKYTVTIDNNGVLSGFELISEGGNGGTKSTFGVNADNLYIGSPTTGKRPFIVTTEPREINGITYPPGTWIDSAYIAEASIKMAHIDKASITSLSAVSATIGTLRTATTGARTEISDNLIKVYDENNVLRVRIGVWDDQDF